MNLKDYVINNYRNGYNCAESMFRGANEYYNLDLGADYLKLACGFGKGMSALSACGVITGSVMLLSYKFGRDDISAKSRANVLAKEFTMQFKEKTSCSLDCKDLLKFRDKDKGCAFVLETGCDILENIVSAEELRVVAV